MDEVLDKKPMAAATVVDTICCQPCSQDGETLPAEAYCTVCKEFMCSTCTKVHKKQRVTRFHSLLDKSSMPNNTKDISIEEDSTEPCDIHPGEFIKYFCPTHRTLNCGHCSVLDHASCEQQIISEIAKCFKEGQGYNDMKQYVSQLLKDIDSCASNAEDSIKRIDDIGKREVAKLKTYRKQVDKYFDEREQALLESITKIKKINETLMDFLKPKCDNLKFQVNEIKAKLEAQENNTSQLFVEAHKAKKILEVLKSNIRHVDINKNDICKYSFRKDSATESLLSTKTGLGIIVKMYTAKDKRCEQTSSITHEKDKTTKPNPSDAATNIHANGNIQAAKTTEEVSHSTKTTEPPFYPSGMHTSVQPKRKMFMQGTSIQIMSPSDQDDCLRSGMLLLPSYRMLLTDRKNNSVKLVNLHTSSLVSQVSVPGCPWDMCTLPCERVAVSVCKGSLYTGSIQFLDTREQKISLVKSITVDKQCRGIGYNNDCLILSYLSGELEKLDLKGEVLKKVSYRSSGHDIVNPFYMTVVIEDQTAVIYVSDSKTNTITKLDMDLNILQTFRDPVLRNPRGITAVENQLLICGLASNNIVYLDLPSGQMTQLLGEDEGIQRPDSVCYNQLQNKLYVSCIPLVGISDLNCVKVYWRT